MISSGFREHILAILLAAVEDESEGAIWRQVESGSKV